MSIRLAVVNQKGGVGKTTSCVNIAAYLAGAGKKCIIIDFDPQGNAGSGLGYEKSKLEKSSYDLISGAHTADELLMPSRQRNLAVIPGNLNLAGAEIELVDKNERESQLKKALDEMKTPYDFLLIDCPPSLGLLTINALVAADAVLIPMQAEYYAMEGISQLSETISGVRSNWNPELKIFGVLMTMVDVRTQLAKQVENEVRGYFGDIVFKTIVPRNVRLGEAPSFGMSIKEYDKRSKGARAYAKLAREIIKRETELSNGKQ